MYKCLITVLVSILLPGSALGAGKECGVLPAEIFDYSFSTDKSNQLSLAFEIPASYQGAKFDRLDISYRNIRNQLLTFNQALEESDASRLGSFLVLPTDYQTVDLVASFRKGDCVRILRASFRKQERVL